MCGHDVNMKNYRNRADTNQNRIRLRNRSPTATPKKRSQGRPKKSASSQTHQSSSEKRSTRNAGKEEDDIEDLVEAFVQVLELPECSGKFWQIMQVYFNSATQEDLEFLMQFVDREDGAKFIDSTLVTANECIPISQKLICSLIESECNGEVIPDGNPGHLNSHYVNQKSKSELPIKAEITTSDYTTEEEVTGIDPPRYEVSDIEYQKMSLDERILLELNSVGIFPESLSQTENSQNTDSSLLESEIKKLYLKYENQVFNNKEQLCHLEKDIAKCLPEEARELQYSAMNNLLELAYFRHIDQNNKSAMAKKSVFASTRHTLERYRHFKETRNSCFKEPDIAEKMRGKLKERHLRSSKNKRQPLRCGKHASKGYTARDVVAILKAFDFMITVSGYRKS